MTLAILSLAPLILIVSLVASKVDLCCIFMQTYLFVHLQVFEKLFAQELKAYERSSAIAEEVFSSVRTVFAFNGTQHEQAR